MSECTAPGRMNEESKELISAHERTFETSSVINVQFHSSTSCKIQLCPVLCITKKSSREGVPETISVCGMVQTGPTFHLLVVDGAILLGRQVVVLLVFLV
ncbi:hypothetical protein T12_16609 [Trichinella patagoniensis]|uniref:Uncharacterized protein n=1 Tax=Trichinella patagoniensis TaxID=990121 RepID=A0A0V1A282_9BILA|nr:hypothetical protein T12_16609 [Trichinella patagoniensis]